MANGVSERALRLVRAATCFALLTGCTSATDAPAEQAGGAAGLRGMEAMGGASGSGVTNGGSSAGALFALGGSAPSAGAANNAGVAGSVNTAGSSTAGGGGVTGSTTGGRGGSSGASASAGSSGIAGAPGMAGAAGAANLPALSVYIAGDSTVSDYTLDPQNPKSQAGWGQMLSENFNSKVKVLNKAVGGRTARRFIQEGSLAAILKLIQPGDYLLVQFGTNDSNTTAKYTIDGVEYPYLAAAETDFKTYLQQYIDGALGKKAIPVLVTPPPRNSAYCNGPRSLANYGQAMIELGKADSVSVVDLGFKTHAHLTAVCPKPTTGAQEQFFKVNADQSIDGTHFQENGAHVMAGFVADGLAEAKLGLSGYRKP